MPDHPDTTRADAATDPETPSPRSGQGPLPAEPAVKIAWCSAELFRCGLPDADRVNAAIDRAMRDLQEPDFARRTHFIGGRFENLYVERTRLPEVRPVLDQTVACASLILGRPVNALRCGFWLNLTEPGQATSLHTHDEDDELLSAVYYVTAPPASGDLILYDGPAIVRITPVPGSLLLFPPTLPHAVETNRSGSRRLSIGLNIGPG